MLQRKTQHPLLPDLSSGTVSREIVTTEPFDVTLKVEALSPSRCMATWLRLQMSGPDCLGVSPILSLTCM